MTREPTGFKWDPFPKYTNTNLEIAAAQFSTPPCPFLEPVSANNSRGKRIQKEVVTQMIQNVKTRALMFLVVLFAFAGWIVAGSSTPATLTINDNFTGTLVHSDMLGTYYDHTLSSADPCVTAYAYSNGLFFIYMDSNSAYPGDCESAVGIEGTSEDRTYSLTFPATSGICTAFALPESSGECTLVLADNQARIRADNLYVKGASSTTAGFLFYVNGTSYTLHTDSSATITASGNSRTATYNGTVSLMTVAGKNSQQVGTSFVCPFQFTATD